MTLQGSSSETIDRLPLALGALGSSCSWCWLFATLNGNAFLSFFPAWTNQLRAVELFGLVVGLVAVEIAAHKGVGLHPVGFEAPPPETQDKVSRFSLFLLLSPVLLGAPSLIVLAATLLEVSWAPAFVFAAWTLIGISVALGFFSWGMFFDRSSCHGMRQTTLWFALAPLIGAASFFVTSFESPFFSAITAYAFLIASSLFFLILGAGITVHTENNTTRTPAHFRDELPPLRTSVSIFAYGTAFGVCLFIAFGETSPQFLPLLTLCFVTFGGGALILHSCVAKRKISLAFAQKIVLPCIIAALLPMPFVEGAFIFALSVLLMSSTIFFDLANCITGIQDDGTDVRKGRSSSAQRIPYQCGEFFGWCLAMMLGAFWQDKASEQDALIALCLILAFLLVLLTTYFPIAQDGTGMTASYEKQTSLDQSCEKITQICGLTPREQEVLLYLAKGRNAEHIQGQLGISMNTVRKHISHIYEKLQVHSQQELIDKVEEQDL